MTAPTDGTLAKLKALHAQTDRRVKAVSLSRNFGKEIAMAAGLALREAATRSRLMDADLQHPPS